MNCAMHLQYKLKKINAKSARKAIIEHELERLAEKNAKRKIHAKAA